MVELLRGLGITKSGVEGPALYALMALLALWIAYFYLRNRSLDAPRAILLLTYAGAAASALVAFWFSGLFENENARWIVGVAYLAVLVFVVRYVGRTYLGVREPPEERAET